LQASSCARPQHPHVHPHRAGQAWRPTHVPRCSNPPPPPCTLSACPGGRAPAGPPRG
jgi:hypothetical protein